MKTLRLSSLVGFATLLVAVTTTTAFAGPGLQYWLGNKPVSPARETQGVKSPDALGCGGCKTVAITEYKTTLPNGKGTPRWTKIGDKHSCDLCTGEISVVNGRTADTMRHDDAKCTVTTPSCCAEVAPKSGLKT